MSTCHFETTSTSFAEPEYDEPESTFSIGEITWQCADDAVVVSVDTVIDGFEYNIRASSRVHPDDQKVASDEIGIYLALSRAMDKIAAKLERQANGQLKHNIDTREKRKQQKEKRKIQPEQQATVRKRYFRR